MSATANDVQSIIKRSQLSARLIGQAAFLIQALKNLQEKLLRDSSITKLVPSITKWFEIFQQHFVAVQDETTQKCLKRIQDKEFESPTHVRTGENVTEQDRKSGMERALIRAEIVGHASMLIETVENIRKYLLSGSSSTLPPNRELELTLTLDIQYRFLHLQIQTLQEKTLQDLLEDHRLGVGATELHRKYHDEYSHQQIRELIDKHSVHDKDSAEESAEAEAHPSMGHLSAEELEEAKAAAVAATAPQSPQAQYFSPAARNCSGTTGSHSSLGTTADTNHRPTSSVQDGTRRKKKKAHQTT